MCFRFASSALSIRDVKAGNTMGSPSAISGVRRSGKAALRRLRRRFGGRRSQQPLDAAVVYTDACRELPVDPDLVYYEAHSGAAMSCNPWAIFEELRSDPAYAHLTHVWVLDSAAEIRRRKRQYADDPRVRFVKDGSAAQLRAVATAGFLIHNTTLGSYFAKRPGQVYVMTWHSAGAMKKMGVDIPGGKFSARNVMRNLLMADFILAPNELKLSMYADAYRMRGLYGGELLRFGYPRNDVTLHAPRAEVIEELQSRGVGVDPTRKIVLYAPTWRGTLTDVRGGAEELDAVRETLAAGLETDEYQILIKPHQYHYSKLTKEQKQSGRYIPRQFNANRLLAAVDILISDYSSIFFDFLVTDRPVLFYVPDLAEYTAERGVYFAMDELPGPVTADARDLAGWINELPATVAAHAERYARIKMLACADEDGRAARRAIDVIFGHHRLPGITSLFDPTKRRVLLHVDDLAASEATEAVLALANGLDPERYDVTVAGIGLDDESRRNLERLTARPLVRIGRPTLDTRERQGIEAVRRRGRPGLMAKLLRPDPALRREWRRRFGDAEFDVVVECSQEPGIFGWMARAGSRAGLVLWQPAESGTAAGGDAAEGVARPLGKASLARLRRTADAVVPPTPGLCADAASERSAALREWEQLLDTVAGGPRSGGRTAAGVENRPREGAAGQ